MNSLTRIKKYALTPYAYPLLILIATFALMLFLPSPAFADPATGGSESAFLAQISGFFSNLQGAGLIVYYGILSIAAVICFIAIGKELIPAFLKTNNEEKPRFKQHVTAAVVAGVVLLALALAPIIVPSFLEYFGATTDVGLGAISAS